MKDLAVLITIFNDLGALEKTLASIDEPDYSFTVVVVAAGEDAHASLPADDYPFQIVWIPQAKNDGMGAGLNLGLDYIVGHHFSFVARLDAGDFQQPDRLAIQYRHFQDRPELVLLGSNALFKDEESGEDLFLTNLPNSWAAIKRSCVFRSCFIHPTVMYRLAPLDDSYRYDLRYQDIEDYVLFTRIAERHPSEILASPLLDCFMRPNGISRKHDRRQLLSGIRHHLHAPRPLDPLWYAYILKRLVYLAVPYDLRVRLKKSTQFVHRPPGSPTHRNASAPSRRPLAHTNPKVP